MGRRSSIIKIIQMNEGMIKGENIAAQGHVIVKPNILILSLLWVWVSFFWLCPKNGPVLGCFKMVYCDLSLGIIRSGYINHFETTADLCLVRA